MSSYDLILKPSCGACGSQNDLYGTNCKHMTVCLKCGKAMAEKKTRCYECGATVTRLIREYNVRPNLNNEKNFFIGRFPTGLPNFSKKKSENNWTLQKDGLQGRQLTDTMREKLKNRPWLLEDDTGQFQFQGHLEGSQSATYYLLMMQGKEFAAIPAGSWYNFNKVAQYKQLTLEEAEEKMKNRRKTADGYERWMMKAANNGAAAFGEVEKFDDKESGGAGGGGGKGRKKSGGDEDEGNVSDRGEEDEDDEAARKNRLGLKKKGLDDDEEGPRGGDHDMDDDDIEKGDDWEHEEMFTDDDEAVGNDPEEREDLAPEMPPPPEIKQDEEDENEEEEGGLSKSGKELKKLLGKANGLNDSDESSDDDSDDMEDDVNLTPVQPSKLKDALKEEPVDSTPPKQAPAGSSRATLSTSKPSKGKRKLNGDDVKTSNSAPPKKVKTENESKPSGKEERSSVSKSSIPTKAVKNEPASVPASSSATGPVTEDEIRAVLLQKKQVTTQDLVSRFKARLQTKEDKNGFAVILRKISRIQKNAGSPGFIVLREK